MRWKFLSLALASLAACATTPKQPSVATDRQFERLKSLEGEWVVRPESGEAAVTTARYRVIGNGSAVVETLFADTPGEMLTVYHLDGGALALTHYCTTGNQPRMVAAPSGDPDTIAFQFAGGTNVDPSRDPHMHALSVHFVDEAHVTTQWTMYGEGKPIEVARFSLVRSWR